MGGKNYFHGVGLDVIELQQSRDMLARSQDLAHIGTWELDLKTGRLAWADEVYRIFGLEPQGFPTTYEAFQQHIHPDDKEAVDQAYRQSMDNGSDSYEIEHRVLRADTGKQLSVHEECVHTRNPSEKVIRSIGMVQDIIKRNQAEDHISANQAELHRLLSEADRSRMALLSVLEDRMEDTADITRPGHAPSR